MKFLRITAADGSKTFVPNPYVIQITTGADTTGAATDYGSGRITRGKITGVKYNDGTVIAPTTIVVITSIPAYTGGAIRYDYGCLTVDGAFVATLSNAVLSN